jgi:hypothetical protein
MSVAVVSSCYGGVDEILSPPTQDIGVDRWLMVTDDDREFDGWETLHQPRPWVHGRFAAKHAKAQPFDYVDTDVAIWLDSGAIVTSEHLVSVAVDTLGDADLALWRHPERDNVIDEAAVSVTMTKYDGQHCRQQAQCYVDQGLPDALYATGCIVWRNNEAARDFGRMWLAEMLRWSLQDQLSFPYVAWKLGVEPNTMPQSLWRNHYVKWRGHS